MSYFDGNGPVQPGSCSISCLLGKPEATVKSETAVASARPVHRA